MIRDGGRPLAPIRPANADKSITRFNFVIRISEDPARADKSAVCAINDSVGKICTDKLTSAGTRQDPAFAAREAAYSSSACEEQEHETRGRSKDCCSFPLHMQVLLIVLGPSFAERRCTDMLTEFTNRVINRHLQNGRLRSLRQGSLVKKSPSQVEPSPRVTPPRSEGSVASGSEILRCAQDDRSKTSSL